MTDRVPRAAVVVLHGDRVLVMKRYVRKTSADECWACARDALAGLGCPGHHYAVIPGGHVEDGETAVEAALRELAEETTLTARIECLLWMGTHFGRPASYFLAADVVGVPTLSGEEARVNSPQNAYELVWAAPVDFDDLNLIPESTRVPLRAVMAASPVRQWP